jgi:hypothetical protein
VTVIKVGKEAPYPGIASIDNLRATVPEALRAAACEVSELLRRAGVRHVLCGGVAVSCNGYGRTTQNIDFAVGPCAFEYRDKGLFLRGDLPFRYLGIPIHYVATNNAFERAMLEQYIVVPAHGDVPVLPIGPLTVMKLISRRHKDLADLVEMFKRRIVDLEAVREFVSKNLPSQVTMLDELILCAENEMAEEGTP